MFPGGHFCVWARNEGNGWNKQGQVLEYGNMKTRKALKVKRMQAVAKLCQAQAQLYPRCQLHLWTVNQADFNSVFIFTSIL